MLFLRINDGIAALLDSKVDNFIAIIRKDNIDKVFTNIVNISLNCSN